MCLSCLFTVGWCVADGVTAPDLKFSLGLQLTALAGYRLVEKRKKLTGELTGDRETKQNRKRGDFPPCPFFFSTNRTAVSCLFENLCLSRSTFMLLSFNVGSFIILHRHCQVICSKWTPHFRFTNFQSRLRGTRSNT